MVKGKDYKYQTLLNRIDVAIKEEFYFEASWIIYAILENRLLSALRESGGVTYDNGKEIRMMGPKIGELQKRMQNTAFLRKAFFGDMIMRLDDWKEKRNTIMHAMADENLSIVEIDEEVYELATTGKDLAREFCAACRRMKKIHRKE